MNMGYACITMELAYPKDYGKPKGTPRLTANRHCIKRTFKEKGVDYVSELGRDNVKDLMEFRKRI